ncbi:MAG: hypothetical protein KF773_18460 [Deltaproteobacteria bacterium]|nr:hypothetical protein [Deltaproteobacteria bacterium]MCW5806753.1 hypothetical protein [Deltaproteobacteria bacterium]
MRNLLLASAALLASLTATGCIVESRPAYVAPAGGWVELGSRTVHGRRGVDRDVIAVGRREGRFRVLQFVVERSSLEMFDMIVYFGDGSVYSPPTQLVFRPGQASQVIDLPGGARIIRKVEFRYRNLPGGGNARVVLLGS